MAVEQTGGDRIVIRRASQGGGVGEWYRNEASGASDSDRPRYVPELIVLGDKGFADGLGYGFT